VDKIRFDTKEEAMGLFKKIKKAAKKVTSKAKKWTKKAIDLSLDPVDTAKKGLKWAGSEAGDLLGGVAGLMAPDIDLGQDPTEELKDTGVSASESVDAEQERAKRYAAYSTDAASGKKKRLGTYGQGTELQKYMDRVKGGLIGGQS
jgi:hypothetical protein